MAVFGAGDRRGRMTQRNQFGHVILIGQSGYPGLEVLQGLGGDPAKVQEALKEARQCCERALGMDNDDEQSRALANKLIADVEKMMKQSK